MPSPFPGIDPFIEQQEWEDFHAALNIALRDQLAESLRPDYAVRVERRIYVERGIEEPELRRANVAILADPLSDDPSLVARPSVSVVATPVECVLPMAEEHRESRLIIRERNTMEVVTVIETLSPTNKRVGSHGRRKYLEKREANLDTRASLVELDLLLNGARMSVGGLPPGDCFALIRRGWRRARASVYAWTLRDPLPTIPIPLSRDDNDLPVDLQALVAGVYDRAGYDMTLDYSVELTAKLDEDTTLWLRDVVAGSQTPEH
jgi:hypothetical protein